MNFLILLGDQCFLIVDLFLSFFFNLSMVEIHPKYYYAYNGIDKIVSLSWLNCSWHLFIIIKIYFTQFTQSTNFYKIIFWMIIFLNLSSSNSYFKAMFLWFQNIFTLKMILESHLTNVFWQQLNILSPIAYSRAPIKFYMTWLFINCHKLMCYHIFW